MRETILIKNGEIALKGLNRKNFEDALVKNIRDRIYDLGEFKYIKSQSTVMVEPLSPGIDLDEELSRTKGIRHCRSFKGCCLRKGHERDTALHLRVFKGQPYGGKDL